MAFYNAAEEKLVQALADQYQSGKFVIEFNQASLAELGLTPTNYAGMLRAMVEKGLLAEEKEAPFRMYSIRFHAVEEARRLEEAREQGRREVVRRWSDRLWTVAMMVLGSILTIVSPMIVKWLRGE